MVSYFHQGSFKNCHNRLNPYCSGRWSRTSHIAQRFSRQRKGLNPCCSGRWSRTARTIVMNTVDEFVLILVVVDNGLVLRIHYWRRVGSTVLILVVVDNGLVRMFVFSQTTRVDNVLILVVVDNGLVLLLALHRMLMFRSPNPCCSGQ